MKQREQCDCLSVTGKLSSQGRSQLSYRRLVLRPPTHKIVDNYASTSYMTKITPNQSYVFWVHGLQGGNYVSAGTISFICSSPLP